MPALKPYIEKLVSLTDVLEETENKRQKILDYMKQAPCVCFMKSGETGKYIYVNRKFFEAMDYRDEYSLLGKTDWQLFPHDLATVLIDHDIKVLKEKTDVATILMINNAAYLMIKFPVVNGELSIGGFGIQIPATLVLECNLCLNAPGKANLNKAS